MTAPLEALPDPNIPLLRKAVEWAEAEAAKPQAERLWDQGFWATSYSDCGTTYCIAGYTVMTAVPNATTTEDEYGDLNLLVDGKPAKWSETAQELLGITRDERLDLFEGTNTIEDVRRAAETIAARAGERL